MQMILLDTHVLVWMASDPKRLSQKAREAIREARAKTGIFVADITLWELAWLAENGRIQVTMSVERFVQETVSRVILQPMTPAIAALAVRLPKSFRVTRPTAYCFDSHGRRDAAGHRG